LLEKLGYATSILRPRRSGKSLILMMLKEFYCVPRIDVHSYDPKTKHHKNKNFRAKSTFEKTLLWDPKVRKDAFKDKNWKENSDWFIDDNMNQWPVIFVSLVSVGFDSVAPSDSEIKEKLSTLAIQTTFEDYDYVLFIKLANKI
jgi:hypothetical protein